MSAGSSHDTRATACVERWPGCNDGAYDPRCCRFPKSCSCSVSGSSHDTREARLAEIHERVNEGAWYRTYYRDDVSWLLAELDTLRAAKDMWSRLAHKNAHRGDDLEVEVVTLREALRHPRELENAAVQLALAAEDVDRHIMDSGLAWRRQRLRDEIGNVKHRVERDREKRREALAAGSRVEDGQ